MIPESLRDAWLQRFRPEEPLEEPDTPSPPETGDVVVRYALVVLAVLASICALWASRTIAVPVVAGIIFGLMLGPLVDRVSARGVPLGVSAGIVVLGLAMAIAAAIAAAAAPVAMWSDRLPELAALLRERVSDLLFALKTVEDIAEDVAPATATEPTVRVASGSPWFSVLVTSTAFGGGLLIFFATVYFYLATRRQIRAQALRLCLGRQARRAANALLMSLEGQISHYFGVITLINLGLGCVTAALCLALGLPYPAFLGFLAFLTNYIPFVGPALMIGALALVGLINESTVWLALVPAAAYFVLHLIESNVVTPLTVGRRLTVNPFLIFLSFVFWLWLWGPVGGLLATPIAIVGTLARQAWRDLRDANAAPVESQPASAEPAVRAHGLETPHVVEFQPAALHRIS
jgi:predicted PurR-regulated permease PerM